MSSSQTPLHAPAPNGRRAAAGIIDAAVLILLTGAFYFVPLLTVGFALPMWGLLAAVVAYSVVPLAAFRATLGMRLMGIELIGKDGHSANPADILFRELIGRALFPAAFLMTLFMGFIAQLLGVTNMAMPSGMAWVMTLASLVVVALGIPGHLLPLVRDDRRSLADLVGKTWVVPQQAVAVPEDEDDRRFFARQRRNRVIGVLVFDLLIVFGAVGVPWLLTRKTEGRDAYADRLTRARLEKEFERAPAQELAARNLIDAYQRAGDHAAAQQVEARHLEALVAGVTCDKRATLRLGERLNDDGRHEAAIAVVDGFTAKCGEWLRLQWVALYAHEQREEWQAAAAIATRLIEAAPTDSDYWWWRGQALAKHGQFEQAAADFHQSMIQRPNGFAAGRYARLVKDTLSGPCEPAFALKLWITEDPDRAEDWARDELSRRFLSGNCATQIGRGKATIKVKPESAVVVAAGAVQGSALQWVIHPAAAYTVIDAATLKRLGLSAEGAPRIELRLADGTVEAALVRVERVQVGKASAENVTVAVVEALPKGVEGILGINFLWRFRNVWSDDRLELSALEESAVSQLEY